MITLIFQCFESGKLSQKLHKLIVISFSGHWTSLEEDFVKKVNFWSGLCQNGSEPGCPKAKQNVTQPRRLGNNIQSTIMICSRLQKEMVYHNENENGV